MSQTAEKTGQKYPFKLRLKAWWEGYDPEDLARYEALGIKPDKPAPRRAKKKKNDKEAEPPPPPSTELPVDPWDKSRVDVAQYIWGPGYCGPGGPEHIIAMSKLLALNAELSMADIGAGLGGPARTLAEEFGVWMTGYEQSETLVKAGNELSTMAGMAKKAPLQHFEPGPNFKFERRYDRAFLKESLHMIEDKSDLLAKLEDAIKPDGLVLIIDYVLGDEAVVGTADYRAWRAGEPHKVYMVTQQELAGAVTKSGLALRVNEDQSQSQIELITRAWKGVDQVAARLMENPDERHLVKTLLHEAELWARRVAMLQSGKLKLVRMLGAKREKKPGMMSNW